MNERTEQLIRELAEKFGTTAEHLWEVMVRQAVIENTIAFIIYGGFVGATIVLWKLAFRGDGLERSFKDEEWRLEVTFLSCAMVFTIVCLMSVLFIAGWVSGIINPEYWALKELLK